MVVVKAWIAKHSTLPSIYSDADATISTSDGRLLRTAGGGKPTLISDALAPVGKPITYTVGDVQKTLTRPPASDRRLAILAGPGGRPVDGVYLPDNQAPVSWDSKIARHESGIVRWPLRPQPREGSTTLLILDASKEAEVDEVLRSRAPILVGSAVEVPGVPLRRVVVQKVSRRRLRLGRVVFDVDWIEAQSQVSGAVPVVTWGEWTEYRGRTGDLVDHSLLELASLIGGMPL